MKRVEVIKQLTKAIKVYQKFCKQTRELEKEIAKKLKVKEVELVSMSKDDVELYIPEKNKTYCFDLKVKILEVFK